MRNRIKEQEPVIRKAKFTDLNQSEVWLEYPHEGNADDKDNGKKSHAFYSTQDYLARQTKYGEAVYPNPTPHSL